MLAGAKSFSFMSNCDENNFKYEVPFFQRPYVWTKDNWEDLLNDLSKEQLKIGLCASVSCVEKDLLASPSSIQITKFVQNLF